MTDRTPDHHPEPPQADPARDPETAPEPQPETAESAPEDPPTLSEYANPDTDNAMALTWAAIVAGILAFAVYNVAQRL